MVEGYTLPPCLTLILPDESSAELLVCVKAEIEGVLDTGVCAARSTVTPPCKSQEHGGGDQARSPAMCSCSTKTVTGE